MEGTVKKDRASYLSIFNFMNWKESAADVLLSHNYDMPRACVFIDS